ncbi:hypothetical protein Tco_1275617 [Tanacetum coccineum]
MKCVCNMWQLSGIPCVRAMVGYIHMKMNPDLGVDEWYSQSFLRSSAKLNLSSSSNLLPSCALVKKNMISEFAEALTPL